MPYNITTATLPCGSPCVRIETYGVVSKEEAEEMLKVIGAGGSMFGVPMVILTQKQKSMSPEARNLFSSSFDSSAEQAWCGVVVINHVLRVTVNFVTRINGNRKVKMFATEVEATRWLDERTREDMAKGKSKKS